jgi:hypothetical protein
MDGYLGPRCLSMRRELYTKYLGARCEFMCREILIFLSFLGAFCSGEGPKSALLRPLR